MDARWLVTPKEGDRYPYRPPVFADVAQRKSIRLISERPTFRNCPSVPSFRSGCSNGRAAGCNPVAARQVGSIPTHSTSFHYRELRLRHLYINDMEGVILVCLVAERPCCVFRGISIMVLRQLCKLFTGVRFSYSPPVLALLV